PAAIPMTDALPARERLLPQMLGAAGYQAALIGKWHLGNIAQEYQPQRRGFDLHYGFLGGQTSYFTHQGAGNRVDWYRNGVIVNEEGYTTDLLAAESIRFIKERDKERPFFLDLSLNAPHTPLEAQEEYLAKYASMEDRDRRTFMAMVEAMDAAIGKVVGVLKDEGIADNTLILWVSDNGGQTNMNAGGSNEPLRGQKGGAYDGGLRVPALAVWPGVLPPGRVHNRLFTVQDWVPTLAEAVGFDTGGVEFDGVSLWKELLGGEAIKRGPVVLGGGVNSAVFSGEYKFVEQGMGQGVVQSLFRIFEDPNEERDVKGEYPEVAAEMLAILRAHPRGTADKAA
ncbi:MAG: sulfatase-like hydrolase/transferase, partial [Acidobacteria bacterium]|nr:sulfatase-like hydrolase/transferase [Acidobacteriota bacterium]